MFRAAKKLGAAYIWGLINFFVGNVTGASLMFLAIAAVLKAKGLIHV